MATTPAIYIGWTAVVIGGLSSIPQLIKTVRTKKVEDLSPLFAGLRISSEVLYAIYGVFTRDWVMCASTGVPLLSDCLQLGLYAKYKNKSTVTLDI